MGGRVKRTYNLSETAVHRVRELAQLPDLPRSQDAVVELAVERLYLEVRAQAEASAWEQAANDPAFAAELRQIAAEFRDGESWPG